MSNLIECACGCGATFKPKVYQRNGVWIAKSVIYGHFDESRFWSLVQKGSAENDCWIWLGQKTTGGYGKFGKWGCASRISWELAHGPIPEGMNVLHDCPKGDNPACVKPEHLWLGTQMENARDAMRKGRLSCGTNRWNAKLDPESVREIRKLAEQYTQDYVALIFGIARSNVSLIKNGKIWKHIQ